MDTFIQIVLSFPTVIFTGMLVLVLIYWLIAIAGLLDIDFLDNLFAGDDLELNSMAGLLARIGLGGVPLTVIFSLLVLFGWIASYLIVRVALPLFDIQLVQVLGGLMVLAASAIAAFVLTVLTLKPVRHLLRKLHQEQPKVILGRVGVVRSTQVTPTQGYASVDDGGAGLVLQVRTTTGSLPLGTRVVLIEQLPEANIWRVVSEDEFRGQSSL